MNKTHKIDRSRLEREKALFLYTGALERGDFATIETVLAQAARDPVLEQMIIDIHETFEEEHAALSPDEAMIIVRKLIDQCLPSALESELEAPSRPLTVGDVCARLQQDAAVKGDDKPEVSSLTRELRDSEVVLPEKLTARGIRQFFERLGISASERVREIFRDAALYLTQSLEQTVAHYGAARRQQRRRSSTTKSPRDNQEK